RDRRRLDASHQVEELVEDHLIVLRTSSAFRMELHRANRQMVVHQALDRAIVQVAMADAKAALGGEAVGIDLEFVILRGHGHSARPQVEHRVVAAMVAKSKSGGTRAGRLADELMPEADAQDREAP